MPDGEIERRVQITVKRDCVLVEYTLGMSHATLAKALASHGIAPDLEFAAMWRQYQAIVLSTLPKKIHCTIGEEQIRFEPVQASYSGWSHRQLVCLFRANLTDEPHRRMIKLIDGNFANVPGTYRIALKGRSGAKIENATVPPIVSRSRPILLTDLTSAEKKQATTVEGAIVID
ncbi:MAG: hypothetical protein AAF664_08185 [Planctomycetota bacterium]